MNKRFIVLPKDFFPHTCALLLFIKFEETVEMTSAVLKPGVGNAMSSCAVAMFVSVAGRLNVSLVVELI
jgi:hypothetical protein